MANIVYSSDLSSANNDNMSNLTTIINSSQSVVSVLDAFIEESKEQLKGGGYDAVRVKLSLYRNVYKTLNQICINYESVVKNANNSMLNYMEGYSFLDDSKLDEYRLRLKQIAGYLRYLKEMSSRVDNTVDYTALINYWTEIYMELYHYKELLEGLAGEDASLYSGLATAISDIENISRAVMGIHESTFTPTEMEKFKKNEASLYNYDPNLNIFGYNIDTSKMSNNAQAILEMLMANWPDGMEEQRYIAIQTALTLLDKGITYSQDHRHAKNKDGMPTQMDCSSFVTYCLMAAGQAIRGEPDDSGAYTGTYIGSNLYQNIDRSDLIPGDIALMNSSTSGGVSNHIGLYLGRDNKGREVWIEVGGGVNGVGVHYGKRSWTVFKRYKNYEDK